jgi:hypothetical protein
MKITVKRGQWSLLFLLAIPALGLPTQQSNPDRKLAEIRAMAEKSDVQAQFELAVALFRGESGHGEG